MRIGCGWCSTSCGSVRRECIRLCIVKWVEEGEIEIERYSGELVKEVSEGVYEKDR